MALTILSFLLPPALNKTRVGGLGDNLARELEVVGEEREFCLRGVVLPSFYIYFHFLCLFHEVQHHCLLDANGFKICKIVVNISFNWIFIGTLSCCLDFVHSFEFSVFLFSSDSLHLKLRTSSSEDGWS